MPRARPALLLLLLPTGALILLAAALLWGRGEGPVRAVEAPPTGVSFDYQLGGAYAPAPGVALVVRDSTAPRPPVDYAVCYVNAFQTQPGARWPAQLLVHDPSGGLVSDPAWPDEQILDLSTGQVRAQAAARVEEMIDRCADQEYDAVELDNLDSYTRSRGAFSLDDAVPFATRLVAHAHDLGLAVAQKNTPELGVAGREEIGFDFAVTEQCDRYDECDVYAAAYGELVYDVEYAHDLRGSADAVCARAARGPSTIVRDLDLVPVGEPGHLYRACSP